MSEYGQLAGGDDDLGIEKAETFLGGLRSELDEGSHLHPSFAALAAAADAVRGHFLAFGITPQRAAEAFQLLRIVDDNDIEWTVGPSSGSWYRRRAGSRTWQAGPAPLMAEPRPGQAEPWMSSELVELLPAARSNAAAAENPTGNQAGIRVVDASAVSPETDKESSDWLLAEWDALEDQLNVLQTNAKSSVSIEDSAAWPVKQMFDKISRAEPLPEQPAAEAERLGLPETKPVASAMPDILDLFVPPEPPTPRADAVRSDVRPDAAPTARVDRSDALEEPATAESPADPYGYGATGAGVGSVDVVPGSYSVPGGGEDSADDFVPLTPDFGGPVHPAGQTSDEGADPLSPPAEDDDPYGLGR